MYTTTILKQCLVISAFLQHCDCLRLQQTDDENSFAFHVSLRDCVETVRQSTPVVHRSRNPKDHSNENVTFPCLQNASFRDVAHYELQSFPGITDQMLRRAWCVGKKEEQTRLNVKLMKGKLRHTLVAGNCPDRASYSLQMVQDVLKRTSLRDTSLEATLYAADLSPDVEHGRRNPLPDFDNPHPILVYQKKARDDNSIAFPEFDFYAQSWKNKRRSILEKSDELLWSQRLPRLLYRGQLGGYRDYLDLSLLQIDGSEHMDLENTKKSPGKFMSHEDHAKYKYLLNLPGVWGGTANRLKYLLATGSTVLVPDNDFYEFWMPLLQPYEHYVPVLNLYKYGGHDIPGIVQCLSKHDQEAQRIGENGRKFIRHVLHGNAPEDYIEALFQIYATKVANRVSTDDPQKTCP